jgi:hypothetical protein
MDHHADLFDARPHSLPHDDAQNGALDAMLVDQHLHRQGTLALCRGRYDRFFDLHFGIQYTPVTMRRPTDSMTEAEWTSPLSSSAADLIANPYSD